MGMEIPLFDADKVPQPKDKIRIESLRAMPYQDRFRVFIEIKVTPFRDRPNLLLVLRSAEGRVVGELSIIETMHSEMEFTMHIRNLADPAGEYVLTADLFFENRNPPQDRKEFAFGIPTLAATQSFSDDDGSTE
jgi:hypothetical protein